MVEDKSEVLYLQQEDAFERTIEQLNDNKVLVLPCDTIYGLCAKMGKEGERQLKDIKIREKEKPFLVLATLKQVQELCDVPDDILKLWPCALTAILNKKSGGTLAVRVPLDPFLQAVLEKLGSPIYSTSINISGRSSLTNIVDIILTYKDRVPTFIVDSEKQGEIPSTLVDVTSKPYKIIRQGKYIVPKEMLK